MTDYTKLTDFASKDTLPTGNPAKIVKGTEIDDEFEAIETAIGTKADLASPTFTGTPTAPTASAATNSTQLATTAFVQAQKASPTFTGTPTAPTATTGTDTTQIATTEFVQNALDAYTPPLSSIGEGNSSIEVIDSGSGQVQVVIDGTTISRFEGTNFKFNSGYGSVETAYGCRAWVNFNGTGTLSVRNSGNVSSVTDNGTGRYTVNFTTSMPDATYSAPIGSARTDNSTNSTGMGFIKVHTKQTSSFQMLSGDSASTNTDHEIIDVSVLR